VRDISFHIGFHDDDAARQRFLPPAEESVLLRACRRLGLSGLISGRVRRRLHLADDLPRSIFHEACIFQIGRRRVQPTKLCIAQSRGSVALRWIGAPRKKDSAALLIRAIYPVRIKSQCIAACPGKREGSPRGDPACKVGK